MIIISSFTKLEIGEIITGPITDTNYNRSIITFKVMGIATEQEYMDCVKQDAPKIIIWNSYPFYYKIHTD